MMLYVDAKQIYFLIIQVPVEYFFHGRRHHPHFDQGAAGGLQVSAQFGVDGGIFMCFLILIKDHFLFLIRDDGMEGDIPFPDLPELLYQCRVAVDADTAPAFHIKFGGIGVLDRVIAADVNIEAGPFILAEDPFEEKVFAAHGMRQGKTFHFEFFHESAEEEMQPGIPE